MHTYQIEQTINYRKMIVAVILSVFSAYVLNKILENYQILDLWYIDYPSVIGFYWVYIELFDNYFWKLKKIQQFESFHIPNLNGEWNTEIFSSFDNFEKPLICTTYIKQTGAKIKIILESEYSISHSVNCAILCSKRLNEYELTFNYLNEPKGDSRKELNIHYGTAILQISDNVCDGEYFTGRGRQSHGRMKLVRRIK